ncbi:MAG: GNAT family N-acetyltransferase [Mycobacteriales bacterium]
MLTAPVLPPPWFPDPGEPLLRRATPDDVVALAALKRRVERRTHAHLGSEQALSVRLHRRCTAWYLLSRLAAGELLLVAEQDGELLGLGAARVERGTGAPALHLHSACVERRGLGLGRALTRARLEAGAGLGLQVVTADCLVGPSEELTPAELRLARLGLRETSPRTPSPTFPGAGLSHWSGSLHTALTRLTPVPR